MPKQRQKPFSPLPVGLGTLGYLEGFWRSGLSRVKVAAERKPESDGKAAPIVKEIYIEAPPNKVFGLLISPRKIANWLGGGAMAHPEMGKVFCTDSDGRLGIRGRYLEIVPGSRVVFTWDWAEGPRGVSPESTVVTIDLQSEGTGTLLKLMHKKFEGEVHGNHDSIVEQGKTMEAMQQSAEIRDIVKGYYLAWTSGNLRYGRSFLADALDFQGSINTFHDADSFVDALGKFYAMLRKTELLKEFYSPSGAMLLYDCVTDSPARRIRTAEYFGVCAGKIFEIRLVFDATRLRPIMGR